MAADPFWRKFEHFVAGLEHALSPVGAVVISPDRAVLDRVTGGLREVDASIRYQIDSKDVLVTIECRDRSRAQDITWIEQLVTKRNDVGAARTIAVTTKPLSSGARKKAEHHGIELRQVDHVTAAEIAEWIQGVTVEVISVRWEIISARFHLYEKDGQPFKSPQIQIPSYDAPLIRRDPTPEPFSPNDLVSALLRSGTAGIDGQPGRSIGDSIELGQPRRRVTIGVSAAEPPHSMRVGRAWLRLQRVEAVLEVWKESEQVQFSVGANYSTAGRHLIHAAEGEVAMGGGKTLIVQWSPSKHATNEAIARKQVTQDGANPAE